MIITFILQLVASLYAIMGDLLPDATMSAEVVSAIHSMVGYLFLADIVVDVDALMAVFGLYLFTEVTIMGVQFMFWAYAKMPLLGKR